MNAPQLPTQPTQPTRAEVSAASSPGDAGGGRTGDPESVPVMRPPHLVLLRLFVPPLWYGSSYLAFREDGEPAGVVGEAAAKVLRQADGRRLGDVLRDGDGALDSSLVDAAIALMEQGLLRPGQGAGPIYWIEPDTAPGTRHIGPGAALFIRRFYSYFGAAFQDGSRLIDSHGDFLPVITRYFPPGRGLECLDAGCGSGHYASALARAGHRVYACDICPARLEAVERRQAAPGEIIPVVAELEDLPLADGSVDFAMCNFVLEHVADPMRVIDELARVLRPGGMLVLSVPSLNLRDTLAAWLHAETPSLNFEHLRSYGLIPKTHPWCAPIGETVDHLGQRGVRLRQIEGVNILEGLWEPWLAALQRVARDVGDRFSVTWPWNCLGRQTVISGIKTNEPSPPPAIPGN